MASGIAASQRERLLISENDLVTIGDYLLCRLHELGLRHIFGVPGDYNLPFLEQVIRSDKCLAPAQLLWVGACNELNAAYAADGYARLAGISALVVTHGVGSLSAINGIAGAYCERVPVVCISGSPSLSVLDRRLHVHHTVGSGNYNDVLDCYRHFTVAQTRLTPANAPGEIDRVLEACWREKRPVYLELPSDISYLEVASPVSPLKISEILSDPERLSALADVIAYRLGNAELPALLLDVSVERFRLQPEIMDLAEKAQAPFAVLSSAKGVITETSPLFLGTYAGSRSWPLVRETIEQSDCLLSVGMRLVDANTCLFTHNLPEAALIDLQPFSCSIGRDDYQGINAREVLRETARRLKGSRKLWASAQSAAASPAAFECSPSAKLSQEIFWRHAAAFLQLGDVILSDIGTSSVGLALTSLPENTSFLGQPVWGSIGYGLPALLGAMLAAANRRHILFTGDGSLQPTVQELSTILRHNLKPIIFLLNNDGYTIERAILGRSSSYNDINAWRYTELPRVFDLHHEAACFAVTTEAELTQAIKAAGTADKLIFIEVMLDREDAPAALKELGGMYAEFEYGPRGPQQEPGLRLGGPEKANGS